MEKLVDFEVFMDETGIDGELLATLYDNFSKEITQEKTKMKIAYQKNDYDELSEIVHTIKGVLGSYRAIKAYDKATQLNSLLKQKEYNKLGLLAKELPYEIEKAVEAVAKYFEKT